MEKILLVALGGALGAVARYGLSSLVYRGYDGRFPIFPVGTLLVNVLGCLLMGAVMALTLEKQALG